jgi:hypothetical protein
MTCLYTKFHIGSFNDSLVITVKLKAKENFRTAAMFLCYIRTKLPQQKLQIFPLSFTI